MLGLHYKIRLHCVALNYALVQLYLIITFVLLRWMWLCVLFDLIRFWKCLIIYICEWPIRKKHYNFVSCWWMLSVNKRKQWMALLLTCGSVALPDSPHCDTQTTNPIGFTGIIRRANVSHFVGTAVSRICLCPTDYICLVLPTRTWLRPITRYRNQKPQSDKSLSTLRMIQGLKPAISAKGMSVFLPLFQRSDY